IDARRPAGIGRGIEGFAALAVLVVADDEIARDQIDLFPMVVHERRRRVDAGVEAQQPGAAPHLALLVKVAGENFLLDPGGIAGGRGPAGAHVHTGELDMGLVHRHRSLSGRHPRIGRVRTRWAGAISRPRPGSSISNANSRVGRTPPCAASVPPNISVPSARRPSPPWRAIKSRGSSIAVTAPS